MVDTLRDIPVDRALLQIPGSTLESRTLSTHSLTSNRERIGKNNDIVDRGERLTTFYIQKNLSKPNIPSNLSLSANMHKPKSIAYKSKINMTLTQNRFISENFPGINKAWNQTSQNFGKDPFTVFGKPEMNKTDDNEMSKKLIAKYLKHFLLGVGTHILRNIYEEDVKQLDNWQIENKKKKRTNQYYLLITFLVLKSGAKYKDILKPINRTDEHSNVMFPTINAHVIDRILKDSDDEEECNKKQF